MNVKDIRRKNLRALARAIGGVTQLAKHLGKTQSQISHLIGTNPVKNIGDRFASHVEKIFDKPTGWLDQEHYDIQEASGIYQATPLRRAYYQVPIISWQEAEEWLKAPDQFNAKSFPNALITSVLVSPQAFAIKVEGDIMESSHSTSFPRESTIIVDTDQPAHNGTYVLAKTSVDTALIFRQLIIDGNKRYLKPLNQRYPVIEMPAQGMIYAVVKVMLMEFK
jgi:SOS-response transcriptional repressor LexA